MGLGTSIGKLFQGDVKGAVDWLFLDEENVAMGERADQGNLRITQQLAAEGLITEAEAIQSTARLESQSIDNLLQNPDFSPYTAFKESIAESTSSVISGTKKGLGTVFGLPFRILPWQFWVMVAAAVAVYTFPIWFKPLHAMIWGQSK